jgi:predicted helicase
VNYLFPLWLKPKGAETRLLPNIATAFSSRVAALTGLHWDDCVDAPKQGNLSGVIIKKPEQTALFAQRCERGDLEKTFGPRDVFDWIYAVLHSPTYRSRYADYLKSDFARIPLPGSKALFQELVPLGTKLVALHLLDADAAPELKDPQSVRFAGHGEARVEKKPEWSAAGGNRVTISSHRWFEGVPERVWNFHIGGYEPAQKWLKDRAAKGGKKASPGRVLTAEDQLHYRRMIVAMDKTIDVMAEIDRVIEKHGGWPAAFRGMSDAPA